MFKPYQCHGWRTVDMASIARAEYSRRAHKARMLAHAYAYARHTPPGPRHNTTAWLARRVRREYRAAMARLA